MDTSADEGEWREALGAFLSTFHWELYVTPTFRDPVSYAQARRAVGGWMSGFGRDAYAYIAYEKGWGGGRTHAHALLGGLTSPTDGFYARLWPAGQIQVSCFDPTRGACWYVAKFPADGEIIGTLRRRTQVARERRYGKSR